MQLIQAARENVCSLLEQCGVAYEITPFDECLYQECIDDATRHGYLIDGDPSVRTYLREGVIYAATSGGHLPHRQTQIWIALYISCGFCLEDTPYRFPEEFHNVYLFNDRFIRGKPQGNGVLDAYADVIRRASDLFQPIAFNLFTASTMNFVGVNLLEYETRSMKILSAAERYPTFQRTLSGFAEGFVFMVFPREIPINDYIQALPEIVEFINHGNDVLSFYKEERAGETTNYISTLAGRTSKSKLEVLGEVTKTTIGVHKRIISLLEGFPEACEMYKRFVGGFIRFHTSTARYRLEDLDL